MNVCIVLGQKAECSRVFIESQEITHSIRGVEVRAFVGEPSIVTLTLLAAVEITGEVGALNIAPEKDKP